MDKNKIQNLIKELLEKASIDLKGISLYEEKPGNVWISVEVKEPHFFYPMKVRASRH